MSTLLRRRKTQNTYRHYTKKLVPGDCQFCEFTMADKQVLKELKHFWVVQNIFGYDLWDSSGVDEHLMLVPKRHIVSLAELHMNEQQEFFRAMTEYEVNGYSMYARSPGNQQKSVVHQHTHFIKLDGRVKRIVFYLKKPHLLLMK